MHEFDPTDEYVLMAQAGLTPMQILASLTTAPAARWKESELAGRVAPGLDADLVVLAADPADDVKNFAKVRCVFRAASSSMHPTERNKLRSMRRPGGKAPLTEEQKYDLNHAFDYAVSLLARRDYSSKRAQAEAQASAATSSMPYEVVVDDLVSMNKVNDERYGQNFVAYRARRGHGPARIRNHLQKSGLTRAAIDEAVKGEEAPDFLALARATRARKFGPDIPKDRKERAKQARFLQYRGFSNDHIRAVLEGDLEDGEPRSLVSRTSPPDAQ